MRKIIVYIATSADGYIARLDGDVAWLDRPRTAGDYGMGAFYKSIDTVLMGRVTYDVGRRFGQESYSGKKNYVFSRSRQSGTAKVEFINAEIDESATRLRSTEGKDIWLVGGAQLIKAFLDQDQIDEFIIHVIPVFIGEGIPLISPNPRLDRLALVSSQSYTDGVVRLHYSVVKEQAKPTSVARER
jgi:dihydrofolate reductase